MQNARETKKSTKISANRRGKMTKIERKAKTSKKAKRAKRKKPVAVATENESREKDALELLSQGEHTLQEDTDFSETKSQPNQLRVEALQSYEEISSGSDVSALDAASKALSPSHVVVGAEESHFLNLLESVYKSSKAEDKNDSKDSHKRSQMAQTKSSVDYEFDGKENQDDEHKGESTASRSVLASALGFENSSMPEQLSVLNAASRACTPVRVSRGGEEAHFLNMLEEAYKSAWTQLEVDFKDVNVVKASGHGERDVAEKPNSDVEGGLLDDVLAMVEGRESQNVMHTSKTETKSVTASGLTDLDGDGKVDETDRLLKELSEGDLLLSGMNLPGHNEVEGGKEESKEKFEDRSPEQVAKAAREEFERDLAAFEQIMGVGNNALDEVAEEAEDDLVLDEDIPNLEQSLDKSDDLDNLDLSQTIHDPSFLQRSLQQRGGPVPGASEEGAATVAATRSKQFSPLSSLREGHAGNMEISPELEALVITHKLVKAGVGARLAEKGFSSILEIKHAVEEGRREEIMDICFELKLNKNRKRRFKAMVEEALVTSAVEDMEEDVLQRQEEESQLRYLTDERAGGAKEGSDKEDDEDKDHAYEGWDDDFEQSSMDVEDEALRSTLRDFHEEDEASKRSKRIAEATVASEKKNPSRSGAERVKNGKQNGEKKRQGKKGITLDARSKKREAAVSFSSRVRVQRIPRLTTEETKELFYTEEDIATFADEGE